MPIISVSYSWGSKKSLSFVFLQPIYKSGSRKYLTGASMTISPYQVNSILKAYSKQSKVKPQQIAGSEAVSGGKYEDVVSISSESDNKMTAFNKISYNLLDIIVKGK
jgi:hypothetical protein